jgi:hypothetical protein
MVSDPAARIRPSGSGEFGSTTQSLGRKQVTALSWLVVGCISCFVAVADGCVVFIPDVHRSCMWCALLPQQRLD